MADKVTSIVGLSHLATFSHGDAADLQVEEEYDAFISHLTMLHVPEVPRARLFRALRAALKPDGRFLIEDYACVSPKGAFSHDDQQKLSNIVGAPFVPSQDRYLDALTEAGFVDLELDDLSTEWAMWSSERHT